MAKELKILLMFLIIPHSLFQVLIAEGQVIREGSGCELFEP